MDAILSVLSVFLVLIKAVVCVYLTGSMCVFLISLWLKRKLRDNPARNELRFFECRWYTSPRSWADRLAKRLTSPTFLSLCDHAATTSCVLFGIGIALLLFLALAP